jgi:hypothetical protein
MIVFLTSCSTHEQRRNEAIMVQIEQQIRLPKGASPLTDYARFYADPGQDFVLGVYMLPSALKYEAAQQCEEVTLNGAGKPTPCVPAAIAKVRAGERLWVGGHENLPFSVRPGCEVITFAFDRGKQRFVEIECVGHRSAAY